MGRTQQRRPRNDAKGLAVRDGYDPRMCRIPFYQTFPAHLIEESAMKVQLLTLAFAFAAAGSVYAAPPSSLDQVNVQARTLDCTPPNSDAQCSAFHRAIRQNFSEREIGMLFGAATAYPEYRTSYDNVVRRYNKFVRAYDAQNLPTFASTL